MDRRAFLRGAGTTLFLPWLPSAVPARAAVNPPAKRLVYWFFPNGLLLDEMRPEVVGPGYELTQVLEGLAPVHDRVTVINGLENRASGSASYSTHEQCLAGLLTDKLVDNPYSGRLEADISVDQYAARVAGGSTPFSSLVLAMDEPSLAGAGNTEIYYETLSWAGAQTPVAPITSPRSLFDRLFAGTDPTATAEELERRTRLRKSVLDAVLDRTKALETRLDAEDRSRLDQFTTGVRDLELRIEQLGNVVCPQPQVPGQDLTFEQTVDAFHDLVVLSLQCDHTRFATFALGPTTAYTTYSFLGVPTDHHTLSHSWPYSNTDRGHMLRIQQWATTRWGDLAAKLAAVPEDGGDLLSNTMLMLVSEFGDSNLHLGYPLGMLLAGGESGGVVQGQHRVYQRRPHVDVLAANLEFAGVDSAGFGQNLTEPIDLST